MTKELLRKEKLLMRKNIKNKGYKDAIILNTLISQQFYKNARTIMTYISYNSEVDTHKLIEKILLDKKILYAPKCTSKTEMEARCFKSFSDLQVGAYGILEPSGKLATDFDLIIVPGVAFNESSHRIGYGAGYYDRFLKGKKAVTVGLFYEIQKCEFESDPHDLSLDYIITEKAIYKRRN